MITLFCAREEHLDDPPAIVVMAKRTLVGHVKTRLTRALSPQAAAAVHAAMLRCVLHRMGEIEYKVQQTHILSLDGDWDSKGEVRGALGVEMPSKWTLVPQGEGDLGDRICRVWRALGGGPAVFLGVDSPDVPRTLLEQVHPALKAAPVIIGPADDGGYWMIGGRRLVPELFRGIDWGTPSVYHQTLAAASEAGLGVRALPVWHDVDEPEDLQALRQRLVRSSEPILIRLREDLDQIWGESGHP